MWKTLKIGRKTKLLDVIAGDKGIIPYEKIVTQNSIDIVPLGDFFENTEFFSALKQKNVSDEDYETSYYLWKTPQNEKS